MAWQMIYLQYVTSSILGGMWDKRKIHQLQQIKTFKNAGHCEKQSKKLWFMLWILKVTSAIKPFLSFFWSFGEGVLLDLDCPLGEGVLLDLECPLGEGVLLDLDCPFGEGVLLDLVFSFGEGVLDLFLVLGDGVLDLPIRTVK